MNFCSGKNAPQEYEPQSERESSQAKKKHGNRLQMSYYEL